ncbi:MAG: amidohydrolase family protein [Ignavibacteriales bacterium]|nr:amidohydrolase family protein [Ignavibacteriales bacterium]
MKIHFTFLFFISTQFAFGFQAAEVFDLVIRNGRVINPETKFDGTANVGVRNGVIAAVSGDSLKGKHVIDATGFVVAPGFIDILSYNPNSLGVWNKIQDGVTTNLAMHGGTATPKTWYAAFERQRPPLNYGASFFYTQARNQFPLGRYQSADTLQIRKIAAIAERALKEGALGVSFSLEYVPGILREETLPILHLAKKYSVPAFFHARYSDTLAPGTNVEALEELIGYARVIGVSVHIGHITSTGGTFTMGQSLAMIEGARSEGLDITACAYPYDFWGTYLNSTRFDKGWQKRFGITHSDLQLGGSRERLTDSTFRRYQKLGKLVVAYAIPEQDVVEALRSPFVMIGSDAILTRGYNNHPRASGTFARTLRLYVREKKVVSLMDAVSKMTLLPAQRLEQASAAFRRKGRVSRGADADIVIFDLERITDKATVEHPEMSSVGIEYVIVGGRIVKDPAGVKKNIRPGRPIKNNFAE